MLRKGIGCLLAVIAAGSVVLAPAPQTEVSTPALDSFVNVADTITGEDDSWFFLEHPGDVGEGDPEPGRNSWFFL